MDIAIYCHAGDKKIIVANDYDGWPEERRNSIKPHLQCPACHAPAHFREKSRHGRGPCFYSRPHESYCVMKSSKNIAAVAAATIKEVKQIVKDTSVLEVNLGLPDRDSRPAGISTRIADDVQVDGEGKTSRRYTQESTRPNKPSRVGGKRLLQYLVCSVDFRQANIKIKVPKMNCKFTPLELFRQFSEITVPTGGREGRWHGFWGRLAGSYGNMEYLRTSGQGTAFIIINESIRDQVYRRWRITSRNITDAYCLVFGNQKLSRNNKIYVKVREEDKIVFWLSKETDAEGRLNEVYASAGAPSSLDPGLQTLQAYSLDALRKDDWT